MPITHDLLTVPGFAGDRIKAGVPMSGVVLPSAQALDQLAVIAGASGTDEWNNQIAYLPLR